MFVRWIHLNHRKVDLSIGVRLPVLDIYVIISLLARKLSLVSKETEISCAFHPLLSKPYVVCTIFLHE